MEACTKDGIAVYSLPGAVAAVCALTSSGLSSRRFAFEAFLPKKKKRRQQVLTELAGETRTMVLYEAPHHLRQTLEGLRQALGDDRRICLCRELTKRFEEKQIFTLAGACLHYDSREPRGEYVVVIEGKPIEEVENEQHDKWSEISIAEHMAHYEGEGLDRKAAMKQVAADRGIPKRQVYDALYRL